MLAADGRTAVLCHSLCLALKNECVLVWLGEVVFV